MIQYFKKIAFAEGVSFLILVFLAMPLKYFLSFPEAVTYFGWIHGILFISYVALLTIVAAEEKWKLTTVILAFIAALLPFGPFWFDKKYLRS